MQSGSSLTTWKGDYVFNEIPFKSCFMNQDEIYNIASMHGHCKDQINIREEEKSITFKYRVQFLGIELSLI